MKQETIKGILLYATAGFFVICMSAFGKALGDLNYHPIEIAFYRSIGGLIILLPFMIAFKKLDAIKTKRHKAHMTRSALGNLCIILWFWGITLLPLATATTIAYIAPIIVVSLSPIILKEKVKPYKWGAVILGFVGTIILVQPNTEEYATIGLVIALITAMANAGVAISLRSLGSSEGALTSSFYVFLYGTIISGVIMPFVWTQVPNLSWILLGLIVTGFINQPLKSQAFRLAPASTLSPIQYFNIVSATIIGYLVWNDVPTLNVIIGGCIVITSNLFIIWKEKAFKTAQ